MVVFTGKSEQVVEPVGKNEAEIETRKTFSSDEKTKRKQKKATQPGL